MKAAILQSASSKVVSLHSYAIQTNYKLLSGFLGAVTNLEMDTTGTQQTYSNIYVAHPTTVGNCHFILIFTCGNEI